MLVVFEPIFDLSTTPVFVITSQQTFDRFWTSDSCRNLLVFRPRDSVPAVEIITNRTFDYVVFGARQAVKSLLDSLEPVPGHGFATRKHHRGR